MRGESGTQENLEVGAVSYFFIKLLWTVAAFFQQNALFVMIYAGSGLYYLVHLLFMPLEKGVLKKYRKKGSSNQIIPLPEFDWKNRDPQELIENYIKPAHPVVLRSFLHDRKALDFWRFDNIIEQFGDEAVFLTAKEKDFMGKLSEVRQDHIYCHNNDTLFLRHPDLVEKLEIKRLEPYSDGMKLAYCQFFIGLKGTGSPFHCAANWNWFHMLDGRKKWFFVNPIYSLLIYPMWGMGYYALTSHITSPNCFNKEAYPLFEHCPVFSVELEKGDVLFNPAWWWHAIENTSEKSVAVASRWLQGGVTGENFMFTDQSYEINRFFSVFFQLGLGSPLVMHSFLKETTPMINEHLTLREKRNHFNYVRNKVVSKKILGIYHKI